MKKLLLSVMCFVLLASFAPVSADEIIETTSHEDVELLNTVRTKVMTMTSVSQIRKLENIYAKLPILSATFAVDTREYYILMEIHRTIENVLDLEKTVHTGQEIAVNYIWTTEWEVFDSNEGRDPLVFVANQWAMIKWFDQWVLGMKVWETKTLVLLPEDAYWLYNEALVQVVPFTNFSDNTIEIVEWEIYNFWFTQWEIISIDKNANEVLIDFNPILAWKTLTFEVELLRIKESL